jgi:hypothetical protein
MWCLQWSESRHVSQHRFAWCYFRNILLTHHLQLVGTIRPETGNTATQLPPQEIQLFVDQLEREYGTAAVDIFFGTSSVQWETIQNRSYSAVALKQNLSFSINSFFSLIQLISQVKITRPRTSAHFGMVIFQWELWVDSVTVESESYNC